MSFGEVQRSAGGRAPKPARSLPADLLILASHADVPSLVPTTKPRPAKRPESTGNDELKGARSVTPEGVGNELRTPSQPIVLTLPAEGAEAGVAHGPSLRGGKAPPPLCSVLGWFVGGIVLWARTFGSTTSPYDKSSNPGGGVKNFVFGGGRWPASLRSGTDPPP